MNALMKTIVSLFVLLFAFNAGAVDLEVNTPGVNAIKQSMQTRHAQLAPYYASGAVGIASDGMIALRDAGAVPLPQRQAVNACQDRPTDRAIAALKDVVLVMKGGRIYRRPSAP